MAMTRNPRIDAVSVALCDTELYMPVPQMPMLIRNDVCGMSRSARIAVGTHGESSAEAS